MYLLFSEISMSWGIFLQALFYVAVLDLLLEGISLRIVIWIEIIRSFAIHSLFYLYMKVYHKDLFLRFFLKGRKPAEQLIIDNRFSLLAISFVSNIELS